MYRTVKQNLIHLSKEDICILKELTHASKNLVNKTLYEVNKFYQDNPNKEYLTSNKAYLLVRDNENFKILNSNMGQQIVASVIDMYACFFKALSSKKQGKTSRQINPPEYLPKDGFYPLIIEMIPKFVNNEFYVPYSIDYAKTHKRVVIRLPKVLVGKTIKKIVIVPLHDGRSFEVCYNYIVNEPLQTDDIIRPQNLKVLAIDLGMNNLATCVTSTGYSFIIDGRKLKSYIQQCIKINSEINSLKEKQHLPRKLTNKQCRIFDKRNNRCRDYIFKATKYIIDYCLKEQISLIVIGYTKTFQSTSINNKRVNQLFKEFPFGQFVRSLKNSCEKFNITVQLQEESYTSKASFLDGDDIPQISSSEQDCKFSGKRVSRGLYKTSLGICINADVNGALNILRKSKVVPESELTKLYSSGALSTPIRIRIHK